MSHSMEEMGNSAYMLIGALLEVLERRQPGITSEVIELARSTARQHISAGNDPAGNLAKHLEILKGYNV